MKIFYGEASHPPGTHRVEINHYLIKLLSTMTNTTDL